MLVKEEEQKSAEESTKTILKAEMRKPNVQKKLKL